MAMAERRGTSQVCNDLETPSSFKGARGAGFLPKTVSVAVEYFFVATTAMHPEE